MKNPEHEPSLTHVVLGIVTNQKSEVLIVQRRKKEKKAQSILEWVFPGGKIKPGEDQLTAVKREVLEETGYQIKPQQEISQRIHPQFPVHLHYLSASLESDNQVSFNQEETVKVKWVKPKELKNYFTTDFDTGVQKYLGLKPDHEA